VGAVRVYSKSLEERVEDTRDSRGSAYEPRQSAPAMMQRAAAKSVPAPRQATPALAAGDDWEEF